MSQKIKVQILPKYPSQLVGYNGVDVTKTGGNYYVDLDWTDYPMVSSYTLGPNDYCLIWNSVSGQYFLVPASGILVPSH